MENSKQDYPQIGKGNVVHMGAAKESLVKLPSAPSYLSKSAKTHFRKMGEVLVQIDRLKKQHLAALEVFANAMAQYQYSVEEINRKNDMNAGSGFIQKFATGATNISPEVTLKNNAEKTLFQCFKIFGMDPKSEKDLKDVAPVGYGDLFSKFMAATS